MIHSFSKREKKESRKQECSYESKNRTCMCNAYTTCTIYIFDSLYLRLLSALRFPVRAFDNPHADRIRSGMNANRCADLVNLNLIDPQALPHEIF